MSRGLATVLACAVSAVLTCGSSLATDVNVIHIPQDQVVYEFVGQFNNSPTDSQQFGYLSRILSLSPIFSSEPEDETTCLFTFFTEANTDRVITNGPFKIINRTGTTTIYLNTPPSNFGDPATFMQGTPVQVSSYSQQVVSNTVTSSFVTVHTNTITQTMPFSLNGKTYRLGTAGRSFRTTYSGQVNPAGPPSGWFGGSAVGVKLKSGH